MSKSANTVNRGTVVTVKPLQLQLPNPCKTCIYCNTVNPLYEGLQLQLQLQRDNSGKYLGRYTGNRQTPGAIGPRGSIQANRGTKEYRLES